MESVKGKLTNMREQLDAANDKQQRVKAKSKAVEGKISRAQDEKRALKIKIQCAQMQLERVENMTDASLDKLERLDKNTYENERLRRKLEKKELIDDGTLSELESQQKSKQIFAQETEQRCREALNKLMLVEGQLVKVDTRLQTAKKSESHFQSQLGNTGSSVRDLAKSEESKQAKWDEYEGRMRWLKDRKDKTLILAESLERKEAQLEQKVKQLRVETRHMNRRRNEMKEELRETLDELNTYSS